MKKLFLILLTFISLQNMLSQNLTYVPFPMDSASWWSATFSRGAGISNSTNHFFFQSTYETQNGHQYAVLYQEYGGYLERVTKATTIKDSTYRAPRKYALLREENKRVYLMQNNEEKILYDFNIKLGDSIMQQTNLGLQKFILAKIDSIFIKGVYRNRYTYTKFFESNIIDTTFNVQIVEGIGSITNHVVEPFNFNVMTTPISQTVKSFISFCEKGELLYGKSCDIYLPKVWVSYPTFLINYTKWFSHYQDYNESIYPSKRNFTTCLYSFNDEIFTRNALEYQAFTEESGTQTFTYYTNYYDSTYQYNGKKVIGGFREKEKKIYFWDNEKNAERLLYDFTLTKGDTFYYEGKKMWVLDTFPIIIGDKYYKNLHFQSDNLKVYNVMEGIGATQFAPHLPYVENQFYDSNSHLIKDQFLDAFCRNDIIIINEGFIKSCKTEIAKPSNTPTLLPEEKLSPNLVTTSTYLHLKNINGLEPKIEIFDILGNKVQSIHLQSNTAQIDVQNLPNGIYFVFYVSTSEHRFIGKMLVNH